jgi:hypothetical protein
MVISRNKLLQPFTVAHCPLILLIETKLFRLKFLWSCLQAQNVHH